MSSPANPVENAEVSRPAAAAVEAAVPEQTEAERLMRAVVRGPATAEPSEADLDRMVEEAMGDLKPEDLTMQGLPSGRHRNEGDGLKRGRITRITAEDVFIDLGGKSEGILPKAEFDHPDECAVGRDVLVVVERFDSGAGMLLLSKKTADNVAAWRNLKPGDVVEAVVTGMNKGGLELKFNDVRAFMPASQVDARRVPDISVFLGQKVQCEIARIDSETKEVVVSRRAVVEREMAETRRRVLNELSEGQLRTGAVQSVTDFGAFVDLGGVDGLLHVSDLSWARVRSVGDLVRPGDVLEVKVLKIDREREKVSLGLKQKRTDPWAGIEGRYPIGSRLKGRVVRVAPFGAFVELEEGVDGLVHISEMSWIKRIKHPGELVKEGNIVEAVVLKIDVEKREVRLGMKQVEEDPWTAVPAKYPIKSVVKGKVTRISDFGAFVELEPGIEGLVHISELAETHVRRVSDVTEPGKEVPVRVLEIDAPNRRIRLSMKAAMEPAPAPIPVAIPTAVAGHAPTAGAAAAPQAPAAAAKQRDKPLRGGLGGGLGKINLKG